jgi:transcriptional regulator with XRE-family HTH domain
MPRPRQTRTVRRQFAERLKEVRLAKGLSQESLAELSGLHRTYVGSVERAERNVSIDNIAKLAEALGVSVRDLFFEGKA